MRRLLRYASTARRLAVNLRRFSRRQTRAARRSLLRWSPVFGLRPDRAPASPVRVMREVCISVNVITTGIGEATMQDMPRREFITKGSGAIAGLAAFFATRHAYAFPSRPGEEVVEWLDQLAPNPVPEVIKNQLVWEDFDSWITPNAKFFSIAHFNRPVLHARK